MTPFLAYLTRLFDIRTGGRGTAELSYRAALESLLNAVGESLEVPLAATHEIAACEDGGRPDFGIYEKRAGNLRCVVEVKARDADLPRTADGAQVAQYWRRYGYVIVTNHSEFILIAPAGPEGASRAAVDVWINADVCWRNLPRDVWEMTIGGYPVIKKWLSYREKRILGRPLRMDEMTYITEVARRLKALILLGDQLDESYRASASEAVSAR